jgi:CHAT domain-containing protein/predicted negative regulator of RcsB-dependent stress response
MLPTIIAALSALMALCVPTSTLQSCGLHSIRWTPLMTNLLRVGSPAVTGLRPVAPPAQAPASTRGAAPSAQDSLSLEPGKPVERELSGGQSHFFKITMISGQYLQVVVAQRGIDVAVVLSTPDGKKIGEADSEHLIVRSETVSAIAEAPGAYLIEVRSPEKTAKTGRYEIKVEEVRAATAEDKYRVAGEVIFREAKHLQKGTLEDKKKSVEKYYEALELYRRATDRNGEAQTLNNIGEVYESLGENQKALEKYNEALPLRRAVGDRQGEAITLSNLGSVYDTLGDKQKALERYNEALPISRAVGDRKGESETLNNIGAVYYTMGEMRKALEKYNEALPICRAAGDRGGETTALNNIAVVYGAQGELQKMLEKVNESLPIFRAIGARKMEAIALTSIGNAYDLLGEKQKALEKYNEALPIYRAAGDRMWEGIALNCIGLVYLSLGEKQKALEEFNEYLLISQAAGARIEESGALNSIGEVYWLLGDKQKALERYNEALQITREVSSRRREAITLHNIGVVYDSLGEIQKALEHYDDALRLRRAVGDRHGEADTLLGIARVERQRGNLSRARQLIEQAIGLVESLRANIPGQALRSSYFANRQQFFEFYIDVLMQMHKQNPAAAFDAAALAMSERARARSLLELLTEARADIRQGVDSSLLERERSLRQRFAARAAAQANLLNHKHTPEQAEAFAKEIASITAEYEQLEAQIRASSPRYAALTQPQPLGLTEIQQQVLDPDTLLLEYSLGENASYLFVVSQTSHTWRQLPKRTEIEAAARRVYELLTATQPRRGEAAAERQARIKEAGERYWTQAAELSRMLLGPVGSQLGKKRLVIVADGALQYIPFAALPAPSPVNDESRNSGAQSQPLFVEHEIVSLPSASTLATLRCETAGRKPAEKSLAVLADPVFTDDDTRVRLDVGKAGAKEKTRSADPDETDIGFQQMTRSGRETGVIGAEAGFGRLLSTRREAAAISALVPEQERKQALDFDASRMTALRPELGEYRIVHFATHGLLNNIHPELSGIVLSLVDKEGQQQDGFLRLQDIYNLKLSAELVVLSACQTGLGKEIKGEGLIGLTRGFMYAGAPRIVASLWKVDDRATSELMKRFYQGLLGPEALRPAGALRQAQLSIWKQKQWREPYYWAAFVLQGEWK